MLKNIPENIYRIMQHLDTAGFAPFLVGGCVRDTVMGIIPHDYDITVSAQPDDIVCLFDRLGYRTIDKGKKFGTVGVLSAGEVIEITPYRIEDDYNDSRHPDRVEFVSDINLDISRRDFTINAMAMNIGGNILDIYGGKKDIENRIIRCVGNPKKRFTEDALRILRAIRFASRLGFEIEEDTLSAMHECSHLLCNISAERISAELHESLMSKSCFEVLSKCRAVIDKVIKDFRPSEKLKSTYGDFCYRLFVCIFEKNLDEICSLCDYLKLSNLEKDRITALARLYHEEFAIKNGEKIVFGEKTKLLLCRYNATEIRDVYILTDSDIGDLDDFIKNGTYKTALLTISGGEIAELGLFDKTKTGKILTHILECVSTGKLDNSKEKIISYLEKLSQSEIFDSI